MFKFWKKQNEEISRENPGFEETEQKTPKAGAILLIVMFVAGLFFGWRALDDLARIPNEPQRLSECADRFSGSFIHGRGIVQYPESPALYEEDRYLYQSYDDPTKCNFNELEKNAGVSQIFLERKILSDAVRPTYDELSQKKQQLSETRYQLERLTGEYSVGLQERTAKVPKPIFPTYTSGASISQLQSQREILEKEVAALETKVRAFDEQFKVIDEHLKSAYKPVLREYNKELRWYDFKVFLLQILFVLPFFWLVFVWYLRLHRKNSPYTMILTAMVGVASVLLLRVILFWFWGLFLETLLRTLWEWIQKYEILRSLIFYGGMILSFAVFGGAVYYLQKRIFDPRRVAIRRFRQKQCPRCQTSLDLAGEFCPNCGYQLKKKCASCGNPRFVDLPACPHCGAK